MVVAAPSPSSAPLLDPASPPAFPSITVQITATTVATSSNDGSSGAGVASISSQPASTPMSFVLISIIGGVLLICSLLLLNYVSRARLPSSKRKPAAPLPVTTQPDLEPGGGGVTVSSSTAALPRVSSGAGLPVRLSHLGRSDSILSSNPGGGRALSDNSETPLNGGHANWSDTLSTTTMSMPRHAHAHGRTRAGLESSLDGGPRRVSTSTSAHQQGGQASPPPTKTPVLTLSRMGPSFSAPSMHSDVESKSDVTPPPPPPPNHPDYLLHQLQHQQNQRFPRNGTPTTAQGSFESEGEDSDFDHYRSGTPNTPNSPNTPITIIQPPPAMEVDPNYIFVSESGIMTTGPIFRVPSTSYIPGEPVGARRSSLIPEDPRAAADRADRERRRSMSGFLQSIGKRGSHSSIAISVEGRRSRRSATSSIIDAGGEQHHSGSAQASTDPADFHARIKTVLSAPNLPNLSRLSAAEIRDALAYLQTIETRPAAGALAAHQRYSNRSSPDVAPAHSSVVVGRARGKRSPTNTNAPPGSLSNNNSLSSGSGSGTGTTASEDGRPPPAVYLNRATSNPIHYRMPGRAGGPGRTRKGGMFADLEESGSDEDDDEVVVVGGTEPDVTLARGWDVSSAPASVPAAAEMQAWQVRRGSLSGAPPGAGLPAIRESSSFDSRRGATLGGGVPGAVTGAAVSMEGFDSMERGGSAFADL
ncbi:hypothetical protein HK101_006553 [Irineochytrium annulatum]|nr:hypothetical protein HK101_006553 [Irineochytrium annulatum]